MVRKLAALGLLLAAVGCEPLQLRNHVIRQAETLSDIQYQQVLDNLAMFQADPAALPFFSLAPRGLTTIQDTDGLTAGVNWDYNFIGSAGQFLNHADKKNLSLTATQQTVAQWGTDSVLNPDELTLMRCVYQKTVGCPGPDCEKRLDEFFGRNKARLDVMQPGWFCVGRLKDVPRNACYVGHYCRLYVWVMPEGMDALTNLTLAILDIATTLPVPVPDPQVVRLAEDEHRLAALIDLYQKYPVKPSAEATKLREEIENLTRQYNTELEEKINQQKAPESELFQRLRKDLRDFYQTPNVLPK